MHLLKGCFATLILLLNVLVCVSTLLLVSLIKLLIPIPSIRRTIDPVLNAIAETWIAINSSWMQAVNSSPWQVEGVGELQQHGWYLVSSNHQSWVDILVLQRVFNRRIPLLKFFLKRELIYVPFMGLAWWALDFPFMRRSGDPKGFQRDLAAARRACEHFSHVPTSVISFLEGTRFTTAKHDKQKSPYRYLLKPKTGGLAIALSTLGEKFNSLIDVTIIYDGPAPNFWHLLSGQINNVQVVVQQRRIPPQFCQGNPTSDPALRAELLKWIESLWLEKDALIAARSAKL
jgi:1-acyl-sn-glycerol-3-phosphate acyltransferase